jgi:hypothetical protein
VLDFAKKLLSLESRIHVVVGEPLDVFGNRVTDEGTSIDDRGRPVDRARYVLRDEVPVFDPQRDGEYTRELAQAILGSFRRHTIPKSTHLLSQVVFAWLRERSPDMDLYRLLRTGGPADSLPLGEAHERVERKLGELRERAQRGELMLEAPLRDADVPAVVNKALAHLGSYHRRAAIARRGDRLFHQDRNLILYYQNRIESLGPGAERGMA